MQNEPQTFKFLNTNSALPSTGNPRKYARCNHPTNTQYDNKTGQTFHSQSPKEHLLNTGRIHHQALGVPPAQ